MVRVCFLACFAAAAAFAQYDVSHRTSVWGGWSGVHTLSNGLVSVEIVPQIGGRVMEYSMGTNTPYWVNPDLLGRTFPEDTASSERTHRLFGGMSCWPVPQDWPWPPPSRIDHGAYTMDVAYESPEYISLALTSEVEVDTAVTPGLQMRRVVTMYEASSRLRIEHRLLNTSVDTVTHGIRMIHQVPQPNCSNHKIYFEKGSSSSDSARGYTCLDSHADNAEQQLTLDTATGVMTYQCMDLGSKVGAYSADGWIAYVDDTYGYAFILRAEADAPPAEYADEGSNVILWSGGAVYDYIEIEMQSSTSPIPNGDSLRWVTNLYRTRVNGPVLDVEDASVISEKLHLDGNDVVGRYGVFHTGRADLVLSPSGSVAATWDATPMRSLNIRERITSPILVHGASLLLYDQTGTLIDTLDTVSWGGSRTRPRTPADGHLEAAAQYAGGSLILRTTHERHRLDVYGPGGRLIVRFSGGGAGNHVYPLAHLRPGTYLCRVETEMATRVQRVVLR